MFCNTYLNLMITFERSKHVAINDIYLLFYVHRCYLAD